MITNLKYNKPVEVSRQQYAMVIDRFSGVIAHRYCFNTKKFYIKLWRTKRRREVESILNLCG